MLTYVKMYVRVVKQNKFGIMLNHQLKTIALQDHAEVKQLKPLSY